jgi:hypothetical protein
MLEEVAMNRPRNTVDVTDLRANIRIAEAEVLRSKEQRFIVKLINK